MSDACAAHDWDPSALAELKSRLAGLQRAADLFKALSDASRTGLALALSGRELCVCELASLLSLSVPSTSYHLRILRQERLVRARREGRRVFYTLDDEHVAAIVTQAAAHVAHRE